VSDGQAYILILIAMLFCWSPPSGDPANVFAGRAPSPYRIYSIASTGIFAFSVSLDNFGKKWYILYVEDKKQRIKRKVNAFLHNFGKFIIGTV